MTQPHYVTTIHPFEVILGRVVGERGTVDKLLPTGASPHTHDPRPSDVRTVAAGTAVFYGAAHLDAWAADLDAPAHIALLGLVPAAYRLSLAETIDPHFWTDPLAVRAMLPSLVDTLCVLDAGGCAGYRSRTEAFVGELEALDQQLRSMLAPVRGRAVFLAQPFFQYFLKRYGVFLAGVVEPIPGKEATPRQVQRLIEQAEVESVAAILTSVQLPPRAARAIAEEAAIPMIQLDPLGGVAGRETYRELLVYNARLIREALVEASEDQALP